MSAEIHYPCQRCTNCCRWPGFVRLEESEIGALARFLRLSEHDFIQRYTRLRPHRDGLALFSVFRHTQEGAIYTIAKSTNAGAPEYTVLCGRQRLCVSRSLTEALDWFRPELNLVPA